MGCHINQLLSDFEEGRLAKARETQVLSSCPKLCLMRICINFGLTSLSDFHEQFKMQDVFAYAKKSGE